MKQWIETNADKVALKYITKSHNIINYTIKLHEDRCYYSLHAFCARVALDLQLIYCCTHTRYYLYIEPTRMKNIINFKYYTWWYSVLYTAWFTIVVSCLLAHVFFCSDCKCRPETFLFFTTQLLITYLLVPTWKTLKYLL